MLHPEKRLYTVQNSVMTEAGIDAGFTRDLYVALGEPLDNGAGPCAYTSNRLCAGSGSAACSPDWVVCWQRWIGVIGSR